MLEVVIAFALINIGVEVLIFAKLSQKTRMKLLRFPLAISAAFFVFNLWVHFGTVVGTTAAMLSGGVSMVVTNILRSYYGWFDGRYYHIGQRGCTRQELGL